MSMRRLRSQEKTFITPVALVVMVILIFCQFFYYQAEAQTKKEVKTEQQEDDKSEDEFYFSQPSSNLPSSSHVELNQTLIFLFEIVFENEETEKRDFNISLPPNRFFKTLFDGVISPNAP